jgi:hypothetical protein
MDLRSELSCLPTRQARARVVALGLGAPSTPRGKCIEKLVEHFLAVPRSIVPVEGPQIPMKAYRRMLSLLDHLPFELINPPVAKRTGRLRAVSVSSQSFSLGTTIGIGGGFDEDGYNTRIVKDRIKHPVLRAMLTVLWDLLAEVAAGLGFSYTTAYVNKNFSCTPHVDRNNVGLSLAMSLGRFTGGRLVCETDDPQVLLAHRTQRRPVVFDGHRPHWVQPYKGTRYSVILYTVKPRGSQLDPPIHPPAAWSSTADPMPCGP